MELSHLAEAALWAVRNLSIPLREPSYMAPDFWSLPLTITRARPLPPGGGLWQDFLTVGNQDLHPKIIRSYVASSFTAGAVAFRWVTNNTLLNPDSIEIPATVSRHLDRLATNPYPCAFRPFPVRVSEDHTLILQARNLTAADQLTYAAVYGWYYPQLRSPDERTSSEGVTDAVRSF